MVQYAGTAAPGAAPPERGQETEDGTVAKSILHIIESGMRGFSKGQKRIAEYILQNYDKAAFMTCLLYTSPSPRDCS